MGDERDLGSLFEHDQGAEPTAELATEPTASAPAEVPTERPAPAGAPQGGTPWGVGAFPGGPTGTVPPVPPGVPPPGFPRGFPSPGPAPAAVRLAAPRLPLRLLLVVALLAAVVGAAAGAGVAKGIGGGGSTVVEKFSPNSSLIKEQPTDIQSILARVLPAVVSIKATTVGGPVSPFGGGSPFGGLPFPGFGSPFSQGPSIDEGTGMIITPSGQVVTNNHVIAGATSITVTLNGSTKPLPASVIGADPADDVALLQIHGVSNLPTVTFGNSADVQVGDDVVAIGNALGLPGGLTVTAGIISAEGRTVQASDPSTGQTETLTDMLQTDAPINPGNSGGPLVNSSAQVIGMNTAVAGSTGNGNAQAQNIGFAIPANKIKALLPLLRRGGTVAPSRAFLGVVVFTLTPQLQQEYDLTPSHGAVVEQVVTGSPADNAGIQPGDVIVGFDGKPIRSAEGLSLAVRAEKPGQRATVTFYQGSTERTVSLTLGAVPSSQD